VAICSYSTDFQCVVVVVGLSFSLGLPGARAMRRKVGNAFYFKVKKSSKRASGMKRNYVIEIEVDEKRRQINILLLKRLKAIMYTDTHTHTDTFSESCLCTYICIFVYIKTKTTRITAKGYYLSALSSLPFCMSVIHTLCHCISPVLERHS